MLYFNRRPMFLFAPDGPPAGGGGGAAGDGSGADTPPTTDNQTGDGEKPEETGDGDLAKLGLTPEQQAQFDQILKARLERAEAKAALAQKQAAEAAKKAAEEASLAEQKQFQELANRRQATIEELTGELETLKEDAKLTAKYRRTLEGYRDQLIVGVDDSIKKLLKPLDVADQLAWLAENRPQAQDGGQPGSYIGPPPAPGGKGGQTGLTPEQKRKRAFRPTI